MHLPHSDITKIKSENRSRYFADLASIPLNAVLILRIMEAKEVEFDIQNADYFVLDPRVVSLIVRELLPCFSSKSINEKGNFLHSKKGSKIANRYVHISDDPLMMCGLQSRTFDNAGVPAQSMLLQDGCINDIYVPHIMLQQSISSSGHLIGTTIYGNIMVKAGRRFKYDFDEHTKALIGEHIVGRLILTEKQVQWLSNLCNVTCK